MGKDHCLITQSRSISIWIWREQRGKEMVISFGQVTRTMADFNCLSLWSCVQSTCCVVVLRIYSLSFVVLRLYLVDTRTYISNESTIYFSLIVCMNLYKRWPLSSIHPIIKVVRLSADQYLKKYNTNVSFLFIIEKWPSNPLQSDHRYCQQRAVMKTIGVSSIFSTSFWRWAVFGSSWRIFSNMVS